MSCWSNSCSLRTLFLYIYTVTQFVAVASVSVFLAFSLCGSFAVRHLMLCLRKQFPIKLIAPELFLAKVLHCNFIWRVQLVFVDGRAKIRNSVFLSVILSLKRNVILTLQSVCIGIATHTKKKQMKQIKWKWKNTRQPCRDASFHLNSTVDECTTERDTNILNEEWSEVEVVALMLFQRTLPLDRPLIENCDKNKQNCNQSRFDRVLFSLISISHSFICPGTMSLPSIYMVTSIQLFTSVNATMRISLFVSSNIDGARAVTKHIALHCSQWSAWNGWFQFFCFRPWKSY